MGRDQRTAAVAVEPQLLADSLRRLLEIRGLAVVAGDDDVRVDVAIVDQDCAVTAGVVIALPREPGDSGSILRHGRRELVDVRDAIELSRLLDRLLL